MTKIKSLQDISWQVTEKEYRADSAISYSTLSTYAREGLKGLKEIVEGKVLDTPSIRFGSAVDTLLTEPEEFENLFAITDYKDPSDAIRDIVKLVWERSDKETNNLKNIDKDLLFQCIEEIGYGAANWKEETKINKVITEGNELFHLLPVMEQGKTLLTTQEYQQAMQCVTALKTNEYTKRYFNDKDWVIYYQLKFKLEEEDLKDFKYFEAPHLGSLRCMFDIILVNYKDKLIIPIDLKTTGKPEYEFEDSFIYWRYDLQSTLYSFILRENCKKDEYFKDFVVMPFRFVPINKFNLAPSIFIHEESRKDKQDNFEVNGKVNYPWYKYFVEVNYHLNRQNFQYDIETIVNKGVKKLKLNYVK